MQRICKTCEAPFDPMFANQLNCGSCKQKKTAYKQAERAVAAEKAGKFINADDYVMPEAHSKALAQYAAETVQQVQSELTEKLTNEDLYVLESVAETMLGLEQNWSRKVQNPHGVLIGGHFCDEIGSAAVEHTHRFPRYLGSATFRQMYQKFLPAVAAWSEKHREYSSPELMADVLAELDGKYILKSKYTPAAPPPDVPAISAG